MDDPRIHNPKIEPRGALTAWCDVCGWVYPWHACEVVRMTPEEEAEVIRELSAVSAAAPAVLLWPASAANSDSSWYCGTWRWQTQSGWVVCVFNDCSEWDYLERIEAPDGRGWDFPLNFGGRKITHAMTEALANWQPTDESGWPHIDFCGP